MANQSPFYFDIGPNAPCWSTQYTLTDFLAEQMPSHGVCALLAVFKYYKLCNVVILLDQFLVVYIGNIDIDAGEGFTLIRDPKKGPIFTRNLEF